MTILDLLLDRVRSLTGRNCAQARIYRKGAVDLAGVPIPLNKDSTLPCIDFGFSPELQAQLDVIPEMVRDENGDRDYPDSFYRPLHKDLNPDRVEPQ